MIVETPMTHFIFLFPIKPTNIAPPLINLNPSHRDRCTLIEYPRERAYHPHISLIQKYLKSKKEQRRNTKNTKQYMLQHKHEKAKQHP